MVSIYFEYLKCDFHHHKMTAYHLLREQNCLCDKISNRARLLFYYVQKSNIIHCALAFSGLISRLPEMFYVNYIEKKFTRLCAKIAWSSEKSHNFSRHEGCHMINKLKKRLDLKTCRLGHLNTLLSCVHIYQIFYVKNGTTFYVIFSFIPNHYLHMHV